MSMRSCCSISNVLTEDQKDIAFVYSALAGGRDGQGRRGRGHRGGRGR